MSKVKLVGKVSPNYYGKFLSELAKGLKSRGHGRVIIKESEQQKYKEPCFYIVDKIQPLMSDETGTRCRAWGRRIFRGREITFEVQGKPSKVGTVYMIPGTHEPDWRLVSIDEGEKLIEKFYSNQLNKAADKPISCVAPMPPVLELFLRKTRQSNQNQEAGKIEKSQSDLPKGNLLLLSKAPYDPLAMWKPIEPTAQEKAQIYPPYNISAADGLVKKENLDRDAYDIHRSDSIGLRWRVELEPKSKAENQSTVDRQK